MANTTKSKITEDKIVSLYMESVLENEKVPSSVFKFCKENKIKEDEFYGFFGSFESLQQSIWNKFFDNSYGVMQKNKQYPSMTNEEKMLTFFFTFFENLTLNRSYVLFIMQEHKYSLEGLAQLKGLHKRFKDFASTLIEERNEEKNMKIFKYNAPLFSEGAWLQFLFILKFWMEDSSPGFEKTDIAIEKSVTTVFQIFESTPLEKIVDFGKFLYKEKFA
ncbi:TetR family transcriptional regulator C-terminal domain-containing protein [Muricauda sp. 334s03]|uniref:TetR family transcriptional regulator C-terminal domain-containing protein n=1 Tax=Flagellimonas yonaguniensis TaxID=3031325 RepID=A0ABT5XW84_9FLAO|nr:TetR family transcriptional regulator C-terminal domain-containing protein [[Muricauda] yonaguniensis]MDF0715457.1 TetR family transcriptional regulator C-terminal domain-containing protein [[Muricauda] yonaguniensis]